MKSLREAIRLDRFPPRVPTSVLEVARFVGSDEPVSITNLIARLETMPASVPFRQVVTTGAALGGAVELVLRGDGSYGFKGHMRATGFPSYSYTVRTSVRSRTGGVVIAAQHSGNVHGTDSPGDRADSWDEPGTDPEMMQRIRDAWPDLSGGTQSVSYSEELGGVLGTAADVVVKVAEFAVSAEVLGPQIAACWLIGSELHDAGVDLPGLGGIGGWSSSPDHCACLGRA